MSKFIGRLSKTGLKNADYTVFILYCDLTYAILGYFCILMRFLVHRKPSKSLRPASCWKWTLQSVLRAPTTYTGFRGNSG